MLSYIGENPGEEDIAKRYLLEQYQQIGWKMEYFSQDLVLMEKKSSGTNGIDSIGRAFFTRNRKGIELLAFVESGGELFCPTHLRNPSGRMVQTVFYAWMENYLGPALKDQRGEVQEHLP